MKTLIVLLTCSAIFLAAANVRKRMQIPAVAEAHGTTSSTFHETAAPSHEAGKQSEQEAGKETPVPPFEWASVETSDYKDYISKLRGLEFPEELIREIIIADVNKLYAPREEPLKVKPVPYDAPLSERRRKPTVQDIENLIKLRAIQIEKQDVLEELLGVRPERGFIRTPNSRNYDSMDYAIKQLPPEKRDEVQRIYEMEVLLDDLNQARGLRGEEELAAYRKVNAERDASLKQILTPEEFDRLIMNATPPGSEMQRRVMGMEPTDEQMAAMWKVTHEHWKEQGGVFGRWRAERVPREQLEAADQKLEAGIQAALGPDRYLDYQMATDGTGQQMRNFASRYNLPRETVKSAYHLQKQIDDLQRSRVRFDSQSGRNPLAVARENLQSVLGSDLYNSWNEGRGLQYELELHP